MAPQHYYAAFQVSCFTSWGESIGVVGSTASLGNWNPRNAVPLLTNKSDYPRWSSEKILIGTSDDTLPIEYKYVCLTKTAKIVWEQFVGNRRLVASPVGNSLFSAVGSSNLSFSTNDEFNILQTPDSTRDSDALSDGDLSDCFENVKCRLIADSCYTTACSTDSKLDTADSGGLLVDVQMNDGKDEDWANHNSQRLAEMTAEKLHECLYLKNGQTAIKEVFQTSLTPIASTATTIATTYEKEESKKYSSEDIFLLPPFSGEPTEGRSATKSTEATMLTKELLNGTMASRRHDGDHSFCGEFHSSDVDSVGSSSVSRLVDASSQTDSDDLSDSKHMSMKSTRVMLLKVRSAHSACTLTGTKRRPLKSSATRARCSLPVSSYHVLPPRNKSGDSMEALNTSSPCRVSAAHQAASVVDASSPSAHQAASAVDASSPSAAHKAASVIPQDAPVATAPVAPKHGDTTGQSPTWWFIVSFISMMLVATFLLLLPQLLGFQFVTLGTHNLAHIATNIVGRFTECMRNVRDVAECAGHVIYRKVSNMWEALLLHVQTEDIMQLLTDFVSSTSHLAHSFAFATHTIMTKLLHYVSHVVVCVKTEFLHIKSASWHNSRAG